MGNGLYWGQLKEGTCERDGVGFGFVRVRGGSRGVGGAVAESAGAGLRPREGRGVRVRLGEHDTHEWVCADFTGFGADVGVVGWAAGGVEDFGDGGVAFDFHAGGAECGVGLYVQVSGKRPNQAQRPPRGGLCGLQRGGDDVPFRRGVFVGGMHGAELHESATAEDPAYYNLYPGDGTVWRFYATDITGKFGDLVSFTDARGRVITAEDFGIDVVRSPNGLLRQILTATRLADIVTEDDHTYTVTVYPFAQKPEMAEGLYVIPDAAPVETWRIERGGDDAHLLLATQRKGNGDPKTYTYRYVPDVEDWTLTRPNGLVEEKSFYSGDDDDGMQVAVKKSADGQTIYSQKAFYFKDYGWSVGAVAVKETLGTDASGKRVTEWDYFLSGENKGKISEKRDWRGNRFVYEYDAKGRLTKETNEAVGHETVYSYAPVDASDILGEHAGVAAVVSDDRPRCEVRYEKDPETEAMVEVSRTYFVYSPTQEIVERAATAGAAYGAAGALRTVRTWYAPDDATPYCAGRLKSVRDEDGTLRVYTYGLDDDRWIETVTQLHEQASEPVSGKTTRSSVVYDRVGNVVKRNQEAFIDGAWHLVDRTVYEYDIEGHVIKETDFAGRVTTTVWGGSCCGKSSITLPDGTRFTYTYDDEGRLIAETKLDPLPCSTHFEYDLLGCVVKTWQDGLNPETTVYDVFGQVISQTDVRGGVTQTAYSLNGNTVTITLPNGATQTRKTDALGRLLELSGTAVQPQVFAYGPLWERVATGARWQRTERNLLGQSVRQPALVRTAPRWRR